jgi:metallo-beta-lactamase class B
MKNLFASLFILSFTIKVQSQETKPTLLPEPANWEFERFELPPAFAPGITYKGVEELRFPPGFSKKDTATYFTYAFVAQLNDVIAISQNEIKDYLIKYYKGLCGVVAKDRKLVIDSSKIAASVEKKMEIANDVTIYNATVNLFGVFADGAALQLNLEIKVVIDAVVKKTYLVIIASPREKTHAVWKKLYEIRKSFTMPVASTQKINEPRTTEEWTKPYQPFRIVGNLYYVGTYDLGCYLITTSKGNILINTGLAASLSQIKSNIETLGFKYSDTKILLTTQAHYDHVGAMAAIKQQTGAQFLADEKDADVLVSGGASDYELSKYGTSFEPIKPDRLLRNNDKISLGNMQLVLLHHPGHTKGSCSYLFTVKDDKRSWKVLIANMPTIVTDRPFSTITAYPEIEKDYAYSFNAMKNITFDIWLASHANQFKLHTKHAPGDAYDPSAFIDKEGYYNELSDLQEQYIKKIKQ